MTNRPYIIPTAPGSYTWKRITDTTPACGICRYLDERRCDGVGSNEPCEFFQARENLSTRCGTCSWHTDGTCRIRRTSADPSDICCYLYTDVSDQILKFQPAGGDAE